MASFPCCPRGHLSNEPASLERVLERLCRVPRLADSQFLAFRRFYETVCSEVSLSNQDGAIVIPIDNVGFSGHESVLTAVEKLKAGSEETANEFSAHAFAPNINQMKAVRKTVQLAYLIDPASQNDYPNGFRFENEPTFPVRWEPEQTFQNFFQTTFPTADNQEMWTASSKKTSLKAWKLQRRLKLQIVRTDDLAEHLVYNPQTKSLAIFHQVEWLKIQMNHVKDRKLDETVEVSLAAGTLPPQLLVETLHTIYSILFPIGTDKRSRKTAERLVQEKLAFDPDLLNFKRSDHPIPSDFKYIYWSKRLRALQTLVEARPPKHKITSWFQRHTLERNALTVAIIGLFLNAFIGLLCLLASIAQALVSYWAWKYPKQF